MPLLIVTAPAGALSFDQLAASDHSRLPPWPVKIGVVIAVCARPTAALASTSPAPPLTVLPVATAVDCSR